MTVVIKVGRRVPKSMKSRIVQKIKGMLGFQEEMWQMLRMSFDMTKRAWQNGKHIPNGKISMIDIERKSEVEDMWNKLEWIIVTVQGDEIGEQEEYDEANSMYDKLSKVLKKMPKDSKDERMGQAFKNTKVLDPEKMKLAYEKGYSAEKGRSVQQILLELDILMDIEWIKDFDTRLPQIDITG